MWVTNVGIILKSVRPIRTNGKGKGCVSRRAFLSIQGILIFLGSNDGQIPNITFLVH